MGSSDTVVGPINLGNPSEFTILELASQVIDAVGSRSRVVHRPLPADDPRQRRPDISRAQEILGWSPRTPLEQGLLNTISYFEDLLRDSSIRTQLSNQQMRGAITT
jgi:UDP-glucuronate decarboxylase